MSYREHKAGLPLSFKLGTASLPIMTVVKITADDTVDAVDDSGALAIGEIDVTVDNTNDLATVATLFRRVEEVTLAGTVAAGDLVEVKSKSGSGSSLEQKWGKVTGTTEIAPGRGVAFQGGNADDTVEVGIF